MTLEEIERILQTVAENQARHSADIGEIDKAIALLLSSQSRYEERQARLSDIFHDLTDKQLKNEALFAENEKRFAGLAGAQVRFEARQDKLEASFQMLEEFVRDFRNETNGRFAEADRLFAETDKKLITLAEAQAKTDEQMKRTDEQIKALAAAQARIDEQIRLLLDRNGSTAKSKAKKITKRAAKKKGALGCSAAP